MYLPKPKHKRQDLFVNMVTVGSAIGATIPTTFGQTKCNVLIDTGVMKSCMSQAYYQQLMLPATRTLHSCNIKSANGTNLCPIGITECEFKIGTKEYKNDFIVCKNLVRPCICCATMRLPRPSSTAECLCLIARLQGEQASAASWEPRPPFEVAEMD